MLLKKKQKRVIKIQKLHIKKKNNKWSGYIVHSIFIFTKYCINAFYYNFLANMFDDRY